MIALSHARRRVYLLMVFVVLAALLRFHALGGKSFWGDELDSLRITDAQDAAGIIAGLSDYSILTWVFPPLYFLLVHGVEQVLPPVEATYRLVSAVCGVACVPAMYWFARGFLRRREAMLAAGLMVFSPVGVYFSQEHRPYSLILLTSLLAAAGLVLWLRLGRRRWLFVMIAGTTALLYTTYAHVVLAATLACAGGLWGWLGGLSGARRREELRRLRWVAAGLALAGVLYLPWMETFLDFLRQNALAKKGAYFARDVFELPGRLVSLEGWAAWLPWMAGTVVLVVALRLAPRERRLALPLLVFLVLPPLLLWFAKPVHYHPRHVIFLLPWLLVLLIQAGRFAVDAVSNPTARRVAGCALVAVLALAWTRALHRYYSQEKENWRDGVFAIAGEAQPQDQIIPGIFFAEDAFKYYRARWPKATIHVRILDPEGFRRILAEAPTGRVWYITSFEGRLPPWLRGVLREQFREVHRFPGERDVVVFLHER